MISFTLRTNFYQQTTSIAIQFNLRQFSQTQKTMPLYTARGPILELFHWSTLCSKSNNPIPLQYFVQQGEQSSSYSDIVLCAARGKFLSYLLHLYAARGVILGRYNFSISRKNHVVCGKRNNPQAIPVQFFKMAVEEHSS